MRLFFSVQFSRQRWSMQIYSFGRTSASPPFSLLLPKPNSAETGVSKLFWAKHWECFRSYLPWTDPQAFLNSSELNTESVLGHICLEQPPKKPQRCKSQRTYRWAKVSASCIIAHRRYRRYEELSLLRSSTKGNFILEGFIAIHTNQFEHPGQEN